MLVVLVVLVVVVVVVVLVVLVVLVMVVVLVVLMVLVVLAVLVMLVVLVVMVVMVVMVLTLRCRRVRDGVQLDDRRQHEDLPGGLRRGAQDARRGDREEERRVHGDPVRRRPGPERHVAVRRRVALVDED